MPKRLTARKTKKQQGGAYGYASSRPSARSVVNSTYTAGKKCIKCINA
jgi:hypothetical protein